MLVTKNMKATNHVLHTDADNKTVNIHETDVVPDGRPPPISNSENELTKKERSTLDQLGSGYCRLFGSYMSRIKKGARLNVCVDYDLIPHDVKRNFVFLAITMTPSDL